jgi:hypothetical protein
MGSLFNDWPDGEARKAAALALLEARRGRLVRRGRRALIDKLLADGAGTIDDVRAAVPVPPGVNPKAFGAVPGPLAKDKIIRPAGFARTARAAGHARPVTVWELIDPPAAVAWLAANPDLPDAEAAGGAA